MVNIFFELCRLVGRPIYKDDAVDRRVLIALVSFIGAAIMAWNMGLGG